MAQQNMEFTILITVPKRAVIKYVFSKDMNAKEINDELHDSMDEQSPETKQLSMQWQHLSLIHI